MNEPLAFELRAAQLGDVDALKVRLRHLLERKRLLVCLEDFRR